MLVDGQPVLSCLMLGIEAVDAEITSVEGLMQDGKPHPLQTAFADWVRSSAVTASLESCSRPRRC